MKVRNNTELRKKNLCTPDVMPNAAFWIVSPEVQKTGISPPLREGVKRRARKLSNELHSICGQLQKMVFCEGCGRSGRFERKLGGTAVPNSPLPRREGGKKKKKKKKKKNELPKFGAQASFCPLRAALCDKRAERNLLTPVPHSWPG